MKKMVSFIIILSMLCVNMFIDSPVALAYAKSTGVNWLVEKNTNYVSKITYGKNNFLATDDNGKIYKSGDGLKWTKVEDKSVAYNIYFLDYSNNSYILGARSGLFTSADGKKWTALKTDKIWPQAINTENGIFMVAEKAGKSYVYTSKDGKKWDIKNTNGMSWVNGMVYGSKKYVIYGNFGTAVSQAWNGKTWTDGKVVKNTNVKFDIYGNNTVRKGLDCSFRGIAYGNGKFVSIGRYDFGNNSGYMIGVSSDGINWTINSPIEGNFRGYSIVFGNGKFYVGGSSDNNTVLLSSKDGVKWVKENIGVDDSLYNATNVHNRIIFANDKIIASKPVATKKVKK